MIYSPIRKEVCHVVKKQEHCIGVIGLLGTDLIWTCQVIFRATLTYFWLKHLCLIMMCLFCYRETIRVLLTPTNRVFSPPTDGHRETPACAKDCCRSGSTRRRQTCDRSTHRRYTHRRQRSCRYTHRRQRSSRTTPGSDFMCLEMSHCSFSWFMKG